MNKKSGKIITLIIAAVLVIAAVVGGILLKSSGDKKELENALNSGDMLEASKKYLKMCDDGKFDEAESIIVDYINEKTENFNNSFEIDPGITEKRDTELTAEDEDMIEDLITTSVVKQFNFTTQEDMEYFFNDVIGNISTPDFDTAIRNLEELCNSKETYYCALLIINNIRELDDYTYSAELFSEIIPIDSKYEDAQAKAVEACEGYMNAVMKTAEEYISKGDYSAAISLLEKASKNETINSSEEFKKKIDEIKKTSAKKYADKANSLFTNGDIKGAVGNMEAANSIYPTNEYKAKIEEYKLYLPFELYKKDNAFSITGDDSFHGTLGFEYDLETNNGKKFYHAIKWYNNNDDDSGSIDAHYNLEGKYDTVSGTIFLPKDSKGTYFEGWFKVYGDGQLIYTSPIISGDTLPKDISFSVTGIQKIKISFFAQGTGGFLGDGPEFGIENLIAYKNLPKK